MSSLLGKTATGPISAPQIETWPLRPNAVSVTYETTELMCNCPVTGQPDIYTAMITWDGSAGTTFESKGMKHYLWGFRDRRLSCEALASQIADELSWALGDDVTVRLIQQVRGGLTLSATARGAAT